MGLSDLFLIFFPDLFPFLAYASQNILGNDFQDSIGRNLNGLLDLL